MKKVIITTRAVYHKIASIEVIVPSDVADENVRDWLWDNQHLLDKELDDKLSNAEFDYGLGLNDMFDDDSSDSETRYDVYNTDGDITYGGHC